ncbi:MAG TPA: tRNA (adenosine(37)-N6)-threonylcarbamoyltransferase complex dimerization subunit type 1 TsaB [Fibrobacteria bacterium]|nr:tRNA (adenosine(37)-N6)-threonylcarbamoyltransferase complex dimerization subunit type 1 TsaB [Fibrobacteria bacterium]
MILALDAATSTVVVGLANPDGAILAERKLPGARGDVIPAAVRELLADTSRGMDQVTEIVCGVGPGSFTGIRIALAFAHGAAFARHLPLVGVSSLRAVACHPDLAGSDPLVLLDALRGEAYLRDGDAPDRRATLEELGSLMEGRCVVAEGKPDFLARMPDGFRPIAACVSVAGLVALRGSGGAPLPNYLRASAPEEMRAGK